MKTIEIKTEVTMNIRDEYRIEINGVKQTYKTFPTVKAMKKFAKENEFTKTYNRLDHRSSCGLYNKEKYDVVILITRGKYAGSFACVNDMGGLMSRLDNTKTRGAWTMTAGNSANDVSKFSEFDKTRWTINKDYEKFKAQATTGKGSLNHFAQAKKLHDSTWKMRLAQFMATLTDEELAEVGMERQHIIERRVDAPVKAPKKAAVKPLDVQVELDNVDDVMAEFDAITMPNAAEIKNVDIEIAEDMLDAAEYDHDENTDIELTISTETRAATETISVEIAVEIEPEEKVIDDCVNSLVANGYSEYVIRNKFDNWNTYKLAKAIDNVGEIGNKENQLYLREIETEYLKLFKNTIFKK